MKTSICTRNAKAILGLAAGLALSATAFAQVTETEPNETKAQANPAAILSGGTITGNTTGSSTTVAGAASADTFRVKTAPAALGIYRHELALTSTIAGHGVTLRGLSQSGNVIGTGDNALQTGSATATPPRMVVWYGFGKEEEVYYRVTGSATTTADYVSTLTSTPVSPIVNAGTLYAGSMKIQTSNSVGSQDNEIWLYDSNFNPIAGAGADNTLTGASGTLNGVAVNCGFVTTLTPGTYYVAVGAFNLANNLASPTGDFGSGTVMDFPNGIASSLVNATTARTVNVGMTDSAGNPAAFSQVATAIGNTGMVNFVQFTVVAAPVPTGVGTATPNPAFQGASTSLSIAVIPAPSSNLDNITSVTCDISPLTLNAAPDNLVLTRDGVTANWIGVANVNVATTVGAKTIPFTITDSTTANGVGSFSVTVAVPPPANDQCSAASTAALGLNTGNNASATNTGDPAPTCQTFQGKGVWWVFTPASDGVATINTEGSTQTDTVLSVFSACGGTQLACDDDGGTNTLSTLSLPVTNGTPIFIMVSSFSSTSNPAGGAYNLNISVAASGACCNNNTGVCTIASSTSCLTGSTYQGDGTTCTPNPCSPTGSCCAISGVCSITTAVGCTGTSTWTSGAVCDPNPCPQPSACCFGTNACVLLQSAACTTAGGTVNAATTCSPNPCGASANQDCATAIALSLNTLFIGNNSDDPSPVAETPAPSCQSNFKQSVWFTFVAPASTAYRISSCGSAQDTVLNVFTGDCVTPVELVTDTVAGTDGCDDDTCAGGEPGIGGISGNGLASTLTTRLVAGTSYIIRLSTWGGVSLPERNYQLLISYVDAATIGSCCVSTACSLTDSTGCTGTFTLAGTCSPNPCLPPTGRCCVGARCEIVAPASCVASGTAGVVFSAGASDCNATGVFNTPCCFADYNKAGGVGVQDIFDFLADWFGASVNANVGGDGIAAPGVQDIFDFLAAWFSGCA